MPEQAGSGGGSENERPYDENGDDASGGIKEKITRHGQRRLCCGIPIWLFLVCATVLVLGGVIGGVAGGLLGTQQGAKDAESRATSSSTSSAEPSVKSFHSLFLFHFKFLFSGGTYVDRHHRFPKKLSELTFS